MRILVLTSISDNGKMIYLNPNRISYFYEVPEQIEEGTVTRIRYTKLMTDGKEFRVTETPNQITSYILNL